MMGRAAFLMALALVKAGEVSEDIEGLRARAMSSDDDPSPTITSAPHLARHLQMSGIASADLPNAYDAGGVLVTGSRFSYVGGDGSLAFTPFDFGNANNLVVNNLGGMGPNFNHRCVNPPPVGQLAGPRYAKRARGARKPRPGLPY